MQVTNNKLEDAINKSGFKLGYIAKTLNISRGALYNKIRNKTDFYSREIIILQKILKLTDKEVSEIFFKVKVDKKEM